MRTIKQISKDLEESIKRQNAWIQKHGKPSFSYADAITTYEAELKKAMGVK